jgi:hypothetical protein
MVPAWCYCWQDLRVDHFFIAAQVSSWAVLAYDKAVFKQLSCFGIELSAIFF